MTPIELQPPSDVATATLQAMRDAAAVADGLPIAEYDGPEPERYRRIFDEVLADLHEARSRAGDLRDADPDHARCAVAAREGQDRG